MKKAFLPLLLCLILTIAAIAVEAPYGYYDINLDGKVEIRDTLTLLHRLLNDSSEDLSLRRVLNNLKVATQSTVTTATVANVDAEAKTVTLSTPYGDGIPVSFAALGLDGTADAAELDSMYLTVTLGANAEIYAALLGTRADVPANADHPLSIKVLNTKSENGSHAEDDFRTASVEVNFRETVNFTKDDSHRYRLAHYPRIKKVKDDLYIMAYHVNELGAHVYWVTSEDSIHWSAPNILYNNTESYAKLPTYTDGPLAGTSDDKLAAVNPDMCVLDNGEILYVYAIRPAKGYRYYPDLSGIYLVRGTVGEDNSITWSEAQQITKGQVWEPFIWQRADGQVEIYWSNPAPYMTKYGYDCNVRSVGVSMILSNDNGYTWTPNAEEGKAGGYLYYRVYNEYIGNSYGLADDGSALHDTALPYFAGQMPAVTSLYDGRSLLGAEVRQLDQSFDFSFATSKAGGDWDTFAVTEDGPDNAHRSVFDAAGPYLGTFPSGEVYLTYHWSGKQYYKMGDPKGTGFTEERYIAVPDAGGMWGSNEIVGSHEVISAGQLKTAVDDTTYEYGIALVHSYLNHRTNAQKFAVLVDGFSDEWTNNTDALFVGSESQAQLTVQTAHDKDNIYFLLSRLDETLTDGDSASLCINGTITVQIATDGSFTVGTYSGKGVSSIHEGEGILTELAIPKSVLGLKTATSFTLVPTLINADGGDAITDTFANADNTAYHPHVVLQ